MEHFLAELQIIGVNPFVLLPEDILDSLLKQSGKLKGPIPVRGFLNDRSYIQTLVRFKGVYRLYINGAMLKDSPKRIGEVVRIQIQYDPEVREVKIPENFLIALNENTEAKCVFNNLPPGRRKEIVRYLAKLKTDEALALNVKKAIDFLLGKSKFAGRTKP